MRQKSFPIPTPPCHGRPHLRRIFVDPTSKKTRSQLRALKVEIRLNNDVFALQAEPCPGMRLPTSLPAAASHLSWDWNLKSRELSPTLQSRGNEDP